jgi:predicted GNAT family acetyltransferase
LPKAESPRCLPALQISYNPLMNLRDNPAASRFEAEVDGQLAVAEYRRHGGVIEMTHTEVPPALEGHGIAAALVAYALAQVRAQGLKVRPTCPYVARYMERHPETQDLRA